MGLFMYPLGCWLIGDVDQVQNLESVSVVVVES